jgi:hypothetical protein
MDSSHELPPVASVTHSFVRHVCQPAAGLSRQRIVIQAAAVVRGPVKGIANAQKTTFIRHRR